MCDLQGFGLCFPGSSALRHAVFGHLAAGRGPRGQMDTDFPDGCCWRQLAFPGSLDQASWMLLELPSNPGCGSSSGRAPANGHVGRGGREGRGEGSHLQTQDHQQDRTNPFTSTAKAQTTRPQPQASMPAWQDPNWLRSFHPFRLLSVCTHQVPTKKLDQTKAPEGLGSSALVACLKRPELMEWVSLGFSRDVCTISEINKHLDKMHGGGARENSQFAGCHESHSETCIPPVPNTATFVTNLKKL